MKKIISKFINKEVLKTFITTRAEVLAVIEVLYENNLVTGEKMGKLVEKYKQDLTEIIERGRE